MLDLAVLESVFLLTMGAWLMVLGGAFLLSQRHVDRASAVLLVLAGIYAILWQQPTLLGVGEAFHVALAQPVFLSLLSGAIFLWTYWLFEQHVAKLEAALDRLGDSLALEQTLVDVLSHDLRNPIAEAQLDVQGLAREAPELAGRLEGIERTLGRATDVMEDGLVYSRLASTQQELAREPIDLVDLVAESVDTHRRQADSKDVSIQTRGPSSLPLEASPLLERAVENLLDNAIKFSPEGGTVTVELSGEPDHARLTITDEGPGLPPEERGRLLERFHQEPDPDGGSGLGLAIVRRLVHLHGGELSIEDAPGGGTRVEFTVPQGDASSTCAPSSLTLDGDTQGGWPN